MLTPEQITMAVGPAGAWGTAFAKALYIERQHGMRILFRTPQEVLEYQEIHRARRLSGVDLPLGIRATSNIEEFVQGADLLVIATSSGGFRPFFRELMPVRNPTQKVLFLTKGLEEGTHLRMSQVALEEDSTCKDDIAVLSGPTVASEVAKTTSIAGAVVAAYNPNTASCIQSWLNSNHLRIYTSADVSGVEYGGALKNVMAMGAGIAEELKADQNSRALLFTRALEEMTRFSVALGGLEETARSLAVVGDLHLSFSGPSTRNFRAGQKLAQGWSKEEILAEELAEGLYTIESIIELASIHRIDIPIMSALYQIIHRRISILEGINSLMNRSLKEEHLPNGK